MKKHEKLIESLAREYAALFAGVTRRYVNMAVAGERTGPLAETAIATYRKKLKDLKQCLSIPSPQPQS